MDYPTLTAPLPKPFLSQPLSWPVINANTVNSGPTPGPVVTSQYSQVNTTFVVNTTGGFVSAGAIGVGSLTIPPLPIGAVVKLTAFGDASATTGNSVNYSISVDGKTVTTATALPTFNTTNSVVLNGYISIKSSSTASIFLNAQMETVSPSSDFQTAAFYDSTMSHQIDIFVNINTAAPTNSFICGSFSVELSNVYLT